MTKLLIVFLLFSGSFIAAAQPAPIKPTVTGDTDYHLIGSPLPKFMMATLDTIPFIPEHPRKEKGRRRKDDKKSTNLAYANLITENDLPKNGNTLIMTFNPTCGHCEDQADQFIHNLDRFKSSALIFICNPVMKGYLSDFIKNHKIKSYPKIMVGFDSSGFITNTFMYNALPQINVYDNNRKLLRIFNGEVPMDTLAQYIY